MVDTQTNQVSTNYDKDWVRNAPIPRFTFFDLINAAPGVNQAPTGELALHVARLGSTTDNSYQLDGTDFTAPLTGAAWPWPNTDAIEEIEVLSLGAPAEYGNLQGAVFNVVTRQGSNAFHGDANFYFQSARPDRRATPPTSRTAALPYHRDKYNDATLPAQRARSSRTSSGSSAPTSTSATIESPAGRGPGVPEQVRGRPRLRQAQLADQREAQAACSRTTTTSTGSPAPTRLQCPHRAQHDQGRARPQPVAQPDLHRRCSPTRPTSRRAYSGFYGKDHGDPLRRQRAAGQAALPRPRHGRDHGRHLLLVRRRHLEDRRPPPRSRTSPTTSWAAATTSSSASSTTRAAATTSRGYNDYICTYSGVPAYGYGYQVPGHIGGQDARASASSSTTRSA